MTTNLWRNAHVEDVGAAIYQTKDKRQAIITSSWIQWAGYLHVELWGDKGYIIIESTTHDTVTVGAKEGIFTTFDYSNELKDSYHRELLYLADCIRKGNQPHPNANDGTAVIAMIEAAYRSSNKRIWVSIK
jgi:predicted dehydrogenase